MRTLVVGAVAVGVALLAAPMAAAAGPDQLSFRFEPFDVPGSAGTQVNGINNAGVFEGSFTDGSGQHGFIDGHGRLVRFDFPGTTGVTQAFAIDNAGDVTGVYTDAAGAFHGFERTSAGTIRALPSPPGAGAGAGQGTFPAGITDAGQIVGFFVGADGVAHGYAQSPAGRFTAIDAPGAGRAAGQGTFVFSVNDAGVICGGYVAASGQEFGFVDRDGQFTSVNDPAAEQSASGGTIADGFARGVTVGAFVDRQGNELGYALSGGRFVTVADPQGAAPLGTVITATNSELVLSGFYTDSNGADHGFIAVPRGRG